MPDPAFSDEQPTSPGEATSSNRHTVRDVRNVDAPRPEASETPTDPILQHRPSLSQLKTRTLRADAEASNSTAPLLEKPLGTFGDYELLALIARGGMGMVYKALQKGLNRVVALKTIASGEFASQEEVQRFQTEAEAAAQLDHPGIVPVHEVGEINGQHYFTMAYVDGGSLAGRIKDKPLPPDEAAALVKQIAEAVAYAHAHGIIHRDLKPANVLLDQEGHPKVSDFGLAKRVLGESQLTMSGQVVGTPSFMPPEQAAGRVHEVGTLSDVYSLGAILYCLLTGRPPFQAANALETLKQVLGQEPVSLRQLNVSVDRDLETICSKCLQKEPKARYVSAQALADDLRRFLAKEPIRARPLGRMQRGWRWCRRNPTVAALGAGIALSLLLGIGFTTYFAIEAKREATHARANEEQVRKEKSLGDRRLYVAEMNLAHQAWLNARIPLVQRRLQEQQPIEGADDLRGFEWHYLERLCHLDLYTFRGHTGLVWDVVFSPDGRLLATGSADGTVRIWDAASNSELFALRGHNAAVRGVAFCPASGMLASAGQDKLVRIWDPKTGKEVRTLRGHTGPVNCVAFSRNGQLLASGQSDETGKGDYQIKLWDAHTGDEIRTLRGHVESIMSVAFNPDGSRLVSGSSDRTVRIWDTSAGRDIQVLRGHTAGINGVAYSPDGQCVASASNDKTGRVWDPVAAKETATLRGHTASVRWVAFRPDSKSLATAGLDRTVRVWDIQSGVETLTLRGHTGPVLGVAYSPDGRRLASSSGTGDCSVKLWDASVGQETAVYSGHGYPVQSVAFSPNSQWLAAGSAWYDIARRRSAGEIKVWATPRGRLVRTLRTEADPITSVAFSPDGRRLATASGRHLKPGEVPVGAIYIWNPADGKIVHALPQKASVWCVAYSPNGQYFASGSSDKKARIWNAVTGQQLHVLAGHDDDITSVVFSPNSRQLATGSADGTVKLWDVNRGTEMETLRVKTGPVRSVAFQPKGRLLAVAGRSDVVELWDTATNRLVDSLVGHTHTVLGVAFSPDGQRLASACADRTVHLWDVETGQAVLVLPGRQSELLSVAFSPDGRQLASGSRIDSVLVWDTTPLSPELIAQREAHSMTRFWFDWPLLRSDAQAAIGADQTASSEVRDLALSLAADYPEDPRCLHEAARAVVRKSSAQREEYEHALKRAETAYCSRPERDADFVITLGIALYRTGRHQDAIALLDGDARPVRLRYQGPHPVQQAVLAMANHKLGQTKPAEAALARLRETMKNPKWANDEEARTFCEEAERMVTQ